ncbi:VanZ family protein [Agromyces italicus]|uniref:VanZ family protein n=1 Tax=Agromyces italicus TaxID=279572 RepID=UPI0003B505E3|nr:VanZ family protein [Agromyces italicus]
MRTAVAARCALLPYLVAVGLIVFLPAPEAGRVTGLVAWAADLVATVGVPREPAAVVIEFAANIVLFVPFGALVAVAWRGLPAWAVIALGFSTSLTIELVQLSLPTRFPTVSDVVANTAGAAVGILVVGVLARRRVASPAG